MSLVPLISIYINYFLTSVFNHPVIVWLYFSHSPSVQTQPGQVPSPGQHGGRLDQDDQPGGGHQGLPEAAVTLQTDSRQDVWGECLWMVGSLSSSAEKIWQVTGFSHTGRHQGDDTGCPGKIVKYMTALQLFLDLDNFKRCYKKLKSSDYKTFWC